MNHVRAIAAAALPCLLLSVTPVQAQAVPENIVGSELAGNWFDPLRDGEGCNLTHERDELTFVLSCYTYLDGEQVWLIGAGELDVLAAELIIDMTITRGAQFGAAFRAEDVIREDWGQVTLQFVTCNTAQVLYEPIDVVFEPFATAYQKIIPGPCNQNRGDGVMVDPLLAGNWFNPGRDGEGIQIALEADGETYVASYYTYVDGRQAWVIGSGFPVGNRILFDDMVITDGPVFGPDFDPNDVVRTVWGDIAVDVVDCNTAQVSVTSALPGFENLDVAMQKIIPGDCN